MSRKVKNMVMSRVYKGMTTSQIIKEIKATKTGFGYHADDIAEWALVAYCSMYSEQHKGMAMAVPKRKRTTRKEVRMQSRPSGTSEDFGPQVYSPEGYRLVQTDDPEVYYCSVLGQYYTGEELNYRGSTHEPYDGYKGLSESDESWLAAHEHLLEVDEHPFTVGEVIETSRLSTESGDSVWDAATSGVSDEESTRESPERLRFWGAKSNRSGRHGGVVYTAVRYSNKLARARANEAYRKGLLTDSEVEWLKEVLATSTMPYNRTMFFPHGPKYKIHSSALEKSRNALIETQARFTILPFDYGKVWHIFMYLGVSIRYMKKEFSTRIAAVEEYKKASKCEGVAFVKRLPGVRSSVKEVYFDSLA